MNMKNYSKVFVSIVLMVSMLVIFSACDQDYGEREILGIEVYKQMPYNQKLGEDLKTTGLVIRAAWDDNSHTVIKLSDITISYDKNRPGQQLVNFNYLGYNCTQIVFVSA